MALEDEILEELQDIERMVEREQAEKERLLALLKRAGIDPDRRD